MASRGWALRNGLRSLLPRARQPVASALKRIGRQRDDSTRVPAVETLQVHVGSREIEGGKAAEQATPDRKTLLQRPPPERVGEAVPSQGQELRLRANLDNGSAAFPT